MAKVYTSGPISGKPDLNRPAFEAAATALRAAGHEVVNPHENGVDPGQPWEAHMRADIKLLMDCDTVALLDDWADSRGACIEFDLAKRLGMRCVPLCILLAAP